MAHTLVLLLVTVFTIAVSHACFRNRKSSPCTNDCQWSAWKLQGSCSGGLQYSTRSNVQHGTCASSRCSRNEHKYIYCRSNSGRWYTVVCLLSPTAILDSGKCSDLEIVTRAEWGALKPKEKVSMRVPVSKLFIHHTDTPTCDSKSSCMARVKNIQYYHMYQVKPKEKDCYSDIAYNYLVGSDGRAYEGRGWPYVGAHTYGFNSKSVAISAIGDFETHRPNNKILKAIANLIDCARNQGVLYPEFTMYGHKQVGSTSCPGQYLYQYVTNSSHH